MRLVWDVVIKEGGQHGQDIIVSGLSLYGASRRLDYHRKLTHSRIHRRCRSLYLRPRMVLRDESAMVSQYF